MRLLIKIFLAFAPKLSPMSSMTAGLTYAIFHSTLRSNIFERDYTLLL